MPKTITYQSSKFFFQECLSFLDKTGKKIYGQKFKVIEEDHPIIFKLFTYFFRDQENANLFDIDLSKGILLMGPIGCGKTSLMNIMRFIRSQEDQHLLISTRKISYDFIQNGYQVIEKYSDRSFKFKTDEWIPKYHCFDDLGVENSLKYFGNDCNVMTEILLSRYDYFISHKMLTHITTNLNSDEIEKNYGSRVRSRLREMMNVISFNANCFDKRA
ncbi:MAG: ATPase [Ekhidna sp.]|uniref:ATPase n=1 Tax=Ekhidna sp. TaxID=2608089 RepID=UPI003297AE2C